MEKNGAWTSKPLTPIYVTLNFSKQIPPYCTSWSGKTERVLQTLTIFNADSTPRIGGAKEVHQKFLLTIGIKTSWTQLDPSETWMPVHFTKGTKELLFCLSFFFSCVLLLLTCKHRIGPSDPKTLISTSMQLKLHMHLISTYCCLIYLSEWLTLHLLTLNQRSSHFLDIHAQ